MHQSVMQWVGGKIGWVSELTRVLELGSLDVNGSVRPLFGNARYAGIDMRTGKGVDVQALAGWLPFPDESFEVVVSTEMFEHDLAFWLTLEEAWRVLRPHGYFLITCRGIGFPPHDHPGDYYRFTPTALIQLARLFWFVPLEVRRDPQCPGVFAIFQKGQMGHG